MSSPLPKSYDPQSTDAKWRAFWEENGFLEANPKSTKTPYCIVMPPPNVTGKLHMGHALVTTLQDILIRWKRMQGFEVLWVPGVDHAGISTQTVVEKHLMETIGKRRVDMDRDLFLSHVWEWKEKNEHRIVEQLRRLGASCDWSRKRFTMDEGASLAVATMFKRLFDKGFIFRGNYLVNWDPIIQTAIADDEVEYEERQGHLWTFSYPFADGSGSVSIATTRPETMLGDTAVAVHPNDERYKSSIGKTILLPLSNREIPLIADRRVDPEFGTGAVKITPAHDPNDNEIGRDHDLPQINIMTPDGKINENGGTFAGLTMQEARKAVVKALQEQKLVEKIEEHQNRVGVSYRSKATIEPYLSKQWFVKMEPFKKPLKQAIDNGEVALIPDHWKSVYKHWIDNLRDWCISRQLWWGHRIPIWYHKDDPEKMICHIEKGPLPVNDPDNWVQDPDVLDTWFSSALWPFSTLGWPEKTEELATFYPNAILVTGHDILFFWVARMLLMGREAMGEVPFPEVFLHGLIFGKSYWRKTDGSAIAYASSDEQRVYDLGEPLPPDIHSKWEKMSKSKGNVIDPIEVIDQYGTDAIRMGLCSSPVQLREIDLDRRRFEEFKNFANKVWNGARFVLQNTEDLQLTGLDTSLFQIEDRWILSQLDTTIASVNKKLATYQFDQAASEAYDFFWNEFCAYYVEICKPTLFQKRGTPKERANKQTILINVLCSAIRLLHPMAPFITEELFSLLKDRFSSSSPTSDPYTTATLAALQTDACIVAPYPKSLSEPDSSITATFSFLRDAVYTIRNIRGEMKLPPSTATDVHIVGSPHQTLEENKHVLTALIRIDNLSFYKEEPSLDFAATGALGSLKIYIPLPKELLEKEKGRLLKEETRLQTTLDKIQSQLANSSFVERAPATLVEKQKELQVKTQEELSSVQAKLQSIQ